MKGYAYDEFGKTEQSGDNAFENEVTFAGSVADLSSGLQYMNARYYQPGTGRFLSQDSYTGNAYDSWTQHLYIYCGNNPTSMIDPTGLASSYTPSSSKHNNFVGKYYRTELTSPARFLWTKILQKFHRLSCYVNTQRRFGLQIQDSSN